MRHRKRGRKLGRTTSHRDRLRRNLIVSLLRHERVVTTLPKAKEFRGAAERLITLARDTTPKARLHDFRRALSFLQDPEVARKLFTEIAPRFADRPGGYTRVVRLAKNRLGDDGPRALWELTVLGEKTQAPPEKTDAAAAEEKGGAKKGDAKSTASGAGKKTKARSAAAGA